MFWWRLDSVLETRVWGLLEQVSGHGMQEGSPPYRLLQEELKLLSVGIFSPVLTGLWPSLLLLSI